MDITTIIDLSRIEIGDAIAAVLAGLMLWPLCRSIV